MFMKNILVLTGIIFLTSFLSGSLYAANPQVFASGQASIVLDESGQLWAWGYNSYGMLGLGTDTVGQLIKNPTPVAGIASPSNPLYQKELVKVVMSSNTTYIRRSDGSVWAMGSNYYGQLGDGTTIDRAEPKAIQGLGRVLNIVADGSSVLVVAEETTGDAASLYSWGQNTNNQLGYVSTQRCGSSYPKPCQLTPKKIDGISDVVGMAMGGDFSVVIKNVQKENGEDERSVWAWGINRVPLEGHDLDTGYIADPQAAIPQRIEFPDDVIIDYVAAREGNVFAQDADGELYPWGSNFFGQMGIGTFGEFFEDPLLWTNDSYTPKFHPNFSNGVMGLGSTHTLIITDEGNVVAMGCNALGQIGNGQTTSKAVCLDDYSGEMNEEYLVPSPSLVSGIPEALSVASGNYHSLVIDKTGDVWAFGYNAYYQLGFGDQAKVPFNIASTPSQVPYLNVFTGKNKRVDLALSATAKKITSTSVVIDVKLTNTGESYAYPAYIGYFFSKDSLLDSSDILQFTFAPKSIYKPGDSASQTDAIAIPPQAVGYPYLIVGVEPLWKEKSVLNNRVLINLK